VDDCFKFLLFQISPVMLSERQSASGGSDDIFTDISQMPAQDENCPDEDDAAPPGRSPYFSSGGRKSSSSSSGYKRKRTGDRKLVKKGKWLSKKGTKDKRSSSSSTTTAARRAPAASTSKLIRRLYFSKLIGRNVGRVFRRTEPPGSTKTPHCCPAESRRSERFFHLVMLVLPRQCN